MLADDHPLLVEGLRNVLQEMPEIEVLPPCTNGRVLIDQLHTMPADVLLLDLNMPKPDGISILKIISKKFPLLKVIIFSSYGQAKIIQEVKALGARGFIPKSTTSQVLKSAVLSVAAGNLWFESAQQKKESPLTVEDEFLKKYQVTKRETEIIRMIALGMTTRQISEKLFLSEFTVNTHRRNICRKLNLSTPVSILNFAKENGLLN